MYNIIIMAGGKGERFWPKSVLAKPKQFHKIISDRTMIQETFFRVYPEIKKENIYIVAGPSLKSLILEQLPELDASNLIVEPEGKNTAPAIGLAAVYLSKRNPESVMMVLTADHVIQPKEEFLKAMNTAITIARQGWIVTFGITPARPAIEYGYIEIGKKLGGDFELDVYRVKMFREKPSYEQAKEYLGEGTFLWNSGLFTFKVSTILDAMKKQMPHHYKQLMKISDGIGTENEEAIKKSAFKEMENISIDYGVLEKAENIVCIRPKFLWDDVGSWGALARHRNTDEAGNVTDGNAILLDSNNNIVLSDDRSIISLIGISNTIVVKEDDKILISNRSQDQKVKELLKIIAQDENFFMYR